MPEEMDGMPFLTSCVPLRLVCICLYLLDRVFDGPIARNKARQRVADAPASYHWPRFRQENLRVEGVFLADGWHLLDAYTPTVLRSDSHIGGHDCLHYCVPGPADTWVVMLYNMLAARAEEVATGLSYAEASSGGRGIGDEGWR